MKSNKTDSQIAKCYRTTTADNLIILFHVVFINLEILKTGCINYMHILPNPIRDIDTYVAKYLVIVNVVDHMLLP